jgi:hypothetical protein
VTDDRALRVSIIVACRNEIQHIQVFLDSLLSQEMAATTARLRFLRSTALGIRN